MEKLRDVVLSAATRAQERNMCELFVKLLVANSLRMRVDNTDEDFANLLKLTLAMFAKEKLDNGEYNDEFAIMAVLKDLATEAEEEE